MAFPVEVAGQTLEQRRTRCRHKNRQVLPTELVHLPGTKASAFLNSSRGWVLTVVRLRKNWLGKEVRSACGLL